MTLRIRYQTLEFPRLDLHIRSLWDKQQFEDLDEVAEKFGVSPSSWAFSGVIWPSGQLLAHIMSDFPLSGKRILEVGCGLGLASLVLSGRHADITASDHNPVVADFLTENTRLNASKSIPFVRVDWADLDHTLGKFDLIIGSDVLYEPDHAELLAGFIHRHSLANSEIVLIDAGRGFHRPFVRALETYGFVGQAQRPTNTSYLSKPFKGYVLRYRRENVTAE